MADSIIYGEATITFPERNVFDDMIQLILNVNWLNSSEYYSYTSEELGLSVQKYGALSLVYELDQFLLTPADVTITLNDTRGILQNHLFGVDFDNMVVKAEIKINGDSDFNGSLIDDSLRYDESTKVLSMGFSSDSNKINEVTLYDDDDVALNPLGYDLTPYSTINKNTSVLKTIGVALLDILKLIDPNITLTINHDWQFGGITPTNRPKVFEYLQVEPALWYNKPAFERLLGGLLKSVAKAFFAQITIVSNSKAYFRKLYYYNSYNVQTVNVLNRIKGYKYHKIKYANSKNTFGTLDGQIIYHIPNHAAYTEVSEDMVSYAHNWATYWVYTPTGFFESAYYVKDPLYANEAQSYYNWMEIVAKLMYHYRSKTYNNRVDVFKMKGINYDYSKNFNYDGSKYQILSMRKYLSEGYTEIEAIYLGAV